MHHQATCRHDEVTAISRSQGGHMARTTRENVDLIVPGYPSLRCLIDCKRCQRIPLLFCSTAHWWDILFCVFIVVFVYLLDGAPLGWLFTPECALYLSAAIKRYMVTSALIVPLTLFYRWIDCLWFIYFYYFMFSESSWCSVLIFKIFEIRSKIYL